MEQPHEHPVKESQRLLKLGILLSFLIFVIEFTGGFWTRSLSLISDAWHQFIDIWSLILSFLALMIAQRPANDRKTFGLHRMEVLAAFLNGVFVFFIAAGIVYASWNRLQSPVAVNSAGALGIATFSLALNLVTAGLFYKRSKEDLNIRGAYLHLVGDALSTVAVVLAAAFMVVTGTTRVDPFVSALIAGIVLWGAGRLLKEALNTLLEGVPPGIQVSDVEKSILNVSGVDSVHDLHVWSICSHLRALSGHVLVREELLPRQHSILETIGKTLKDRFGIAHTTIQVESKAWPSQETLEPIHHA
jgi:cobalt-zinc-cadmium efflux system protein